MLCAVAARYLQPVQEPWPTSALPPIATEYRTSSNVRKVPTGDVPRAWLGSNPRALHSNVCSTCLRFQRGNVRQLALERDGNMAIVSKNENRISDSIKQFVFACARKTSNLASTRVTHRSTRELGRANTQQTHKALKGGTNDSLRQQL